ncbi:MAG TPA: CpsB/CapC family capsule biosynthesis tyrosine phosphatase [Polyangiaceae bacterium]|nr:CpsB/CapC family capsule biosynthesis tyrosine phosphatase [Polyangiaceae bacterium]
MNGFIDLHLHYLPSVDDGVKTLEEALTVCRGLKTLGYAQLVTTPHIRSGMFENRRPDLEHAFAALREQIGAEEETLPELALSAEHHCDSLFLELFEANQLLPFPGSHALLLEFPNEALPVAFDRLAFRLAHKGLRAIIAHPERYVPLFKNTDPVEHLLDQEVGLQLDLMSLVGKYGRSARKAAERMLEEGAYTIAATDTHGPEDLKRVAQALELLHKLVGSEEAHVLLAENPRRLLCGEPTL